MVMFLIIIGVVAGVLFGWNLRRVSLENRQKKKCVNLKEVRRNG